MQAVLGSACRVVLVLHAASGLCRVVHVPGMFVQQQGSACRAVLVLQAVNVSAAETPAEPQPSHSSLPGH